MTQEQEKVLERPVEYTGEGISVRALEESISDARRQQDVKVGELRQLRERNVEIQKAMAEEVRKLRKLSDYVSAGRLKGGFVANLKEILSYIPGIRRLSITQRSIEELLRQQYEISARRVKEAAEFADRLTAAESQLRDEIDRLNERIIDSAKNEERAANYLLEVNAVFQEAQARVAAQETGSVAVREAQAEVDRIKRVLADHSMRLQLYATAEDRLSRLKEGSVRIAETIANLQTDIRQYVVAAGEKLDLAAGQIQAIGTAADASVVVLELKRSLDAMTASMNETTRFVSETQIYFRKTIDDLVGELEIYDDQTRKVLETNLAASREIEDRRIAEAVQTALQRKAEGGGPEGAGAAG